MKLDSPFVNGLGGLLASVLVRHWVATLDYGIAYYDRAVDPVQPECRGQKILLLWHEYLMVPLGLRGHCNIAMLVSRHRDAEILSRLAHHIGFESIRGSTNRGGVQALRELFRKSQNMHLVITPDGPRGPRRVLTPGAIYLASKLGLPLVAIGVGFDRPWRMPTWDRFALPRPYSRARGILSSEIFIPPRLDRDGIESYRQRVEQVLLRLTTEAERWAQSQARMRGQERVLRGPRRISRKLKVES